MTTGEVSTDLIVIGAGAAGLATAIFAARAAPALRVVCLDGARRIGAKILVSGGSRCNVTNRVVTERDFWGGSPRVGSQRAARVSRQRAPRRSSPSSAWRCTRRKTASCFPTPIARGRCSTRCCGKRRGSASRSSPASASSRRAAAAGDGFMVASTAGRRSARRARRGAGDRRAVAAEDRQRRLRLRAGARGSVTACSTRRRRWRRCCSMAGEALAGVSHPAAMTLRVERARGSVGSRGRCSGRISAPAVRWR